MSMFEQPYTVTFLEEVLNTGVTTGTVRGAYQNNAIAPDEKLLVVEVESDLDEINELAKVNTGEGWVNAILTEDAEPYFADGEPLDSIRAMVNMADAVLANKLHPCKNGDIFGMGQMFTSENLSNFRAAGEQLGLMDGPQFQTFLIANPLFEIAVGEDTTQGLMNMCASFDEVQSAYDAGTNIWKEMVAMYRQSEVIAIPDADAGHLDVCRGLYLGRKDDLFGRTEHIGICNLGFYTYQDDWTASVNTAKSVIPFKSSEDSDDISFVDTQRLKADFGWVPDNELIVKAMGMPFIEESVTDLSSLNAMNMFGTVDDDYEEMEG